MPPCSPPNDIIASMGDLQMPSDITAHPLSPLWSKRWEEPTFKMIVQAEFKWRVGGRKCAERSARRALSGCCGMDPPGPDSSAPSSLSVRPSAEETSMRPITHPFFFLMRASKKLIKNTGSTWYRLCCSCTSFSHCSQMLLP